MVESISLSGLVDVLSGEKANLSSGQCYQPVNAFLHQALVNSRLLVPET